MSTLERINELVEKKGTTKSAVLKELGLNPNTFVNWEKRNTKPKGETLLKIARYFGVTTDYLIGSEADESLTEPATDKQLKFALYGDAEIDDEILNAVKQFAEFQLEQMKKGKKKDD